MALKVKELFYKEIEDEQGTGSTVKVRDSIVKPLKTGGQVNQYEHYNDFEYH